MAIKAQGSATVYDFNDVKEVVTWYKTVSRTSSAPTVASNATEAQMTTNGWSKTEPAVDTTKKLYTVQQTVFGDNSYVWGTVNLSSSYEAAIQAYNKASGAESAATTVSQYFWYKDGTGAEAGAHVTEIPQEDFETTPSGGNLLMKSNKVALRNALVELASFGANGATIGQTENGKSRSEITSNGMRIVRRDSNADTEIANLGYGSGNDSQGNVSDAPYYTLGTRENETQNYSSASAYDVGDMVTYNGSVYICVERITTPESFTPSHWSSILKGNYSCAEGYGVIAQQMASHAEGGHTRAMGRYSHAEGYFSVASGMCSHVEGNAVASGTYSHAEGTSYAIGGYAHAEGGANASGFTSHAEGGSTATGDWSHAEGDGSLASASCSHAQNFNTVAGYNYQTAIGKWNDNKSSNIFEIGIGTGSTDKKNALEINSTNGNMKVLGDIYIRNHYEYIGYRVTSTGTYSCPSNTSWNTVPTSGTAGSMAGVTLNPGTWIVVVKGEFTSNATGRRALAIYDATNSTRFGESEINQTAINGAITKMQTVMTVVLEGPARLTPQVSQNSGSANSVSLNINATRIA